MNDADGLDPWPGNPFEDPRPRLESVAVGQETLRIGDRVRLRPLGRADIFDVVLAGKSATIVAIEQDFEDRVLLAVTVDDDPGNDFGRDSRPAHRFFFGVEEVEPEPGEARPAQSVED